MTVLLAEDCRHGRFLYLDNDRFIGRCLAGYGEYSADEVTALVGALPPGAVVVEAGSNIGAITVPLAAAAGTVLAFEPQPFVYNVLCGNLALNGCANVKAFPIALGRGGTMALPPGLDYAAPSANFGGVSLVAGDSVAVAALDRLELPRLDLLKVDVEGMEIDVLEGARRTIERCRPVLYVEDDRAENSGRLRALIASLGYDYTVHTPPLVRAHDNWRGNPDSLERATVVSVNLLCRPKG